MIKCTFEDGNVASPGLRHVTVGAIVYNDHGQVLLVKRSGKYSGAFKYAIPGGFLDRDLTVKETVLKELQEEAGWTGTIEELFHLNDNPFRPNEDRQNVDFIYTVKAIDGKFVENDEIISTAWFDEENLPAQEEFAFDHRAVLLKFFAYQKEKFSLPIIGKINI